MRVTMKLKVTNIVAHANSLHNPTRLKLNELYRTAKVDTTYRSI